MGQVLQVEGQVLLASATIEIWQVDAKGRYLRRGETFGCCTTASARRSCTVFGGVGSQSAPPGPAPGKVKVRFSERNMPTLPAGYMMGPNGQAVRIPGLPPGKGMEQPG